MFDRLVTFVKENIVLAFQISFYSKAFIRNKREKIINEFNLNKFVDTFVIVESTINHQGQNKKLNFDIKKF